MTIEKTVTPFTPGPWIVQYGSVFTREAHPLGQNSDAPEITIANMARDEDRTRPTERDANARLIAAAPSLFQMLSEAVTWLEAMDDAHDLPQSGRNLLREAREAIRLVEEV